MNRLREIRELRGFKQTGLAAASGIAQSEISRIERIGITPQSAVKRGRLAHALKIAPEDLFPDPVGAKPGEPLPPKRVLFKSSEYEDYRPALPAAPAVNEPVPMTRAICRWCGIQYRVDNEVKIVVGENTIKTYGHLSCLEQDVRSDGLELKKRHVPR